MAGRRACVISDFKKGNEHETYADCIKPDGFGNGAQHRSGNRWGPLPFHGPPVGFYGPVVYPAPVVYAAPVAYPAPVVTYQPAYVVPAAVAVAPAYAPVVPQYPAVGYYYAPRPAYVVPVGYRRGLFGGLHPRDVEIELDYRRNGGYRYEIDFD